MTLFVDPRREDDRPRRVPPRRRPRGARRRGPRQLPRAVLRPRDLDPARGLRAGRRWARARPIQTFLDRAARRPGPPARAAARREARADGARDAQRRASTLAREHARWLADQGKTLAALEELAEALGLPGPPLRIECYDISNFQGASRSAAWSCSRTASRGPASTAGSGSGPSQGPNDFASHQEVLRRRFRVTRSGEEGSEEERRWAMPDLVIVDGGKGQVSAAKAVLDELGLHDLPLAGLAKEREELFLPGRAGPDRPAADVVGALPRPAPARRGAPVRDHVPPRRCATGARSARRSTTCPASGRSASASCSRSSARSSGCARRRSSRSPRSRASAGPWPSGSRPRWRPERRVAHCHALTASPAVRGRSV